MWDPYGEFESAVLPNGLTVHVAHWPDRPWEAVGFLVHSGAEHDLVGLEGTAHFVEHLAFGNEGVPKNELKKFFENNGGDVNFGVTYYPYTKYNFFLPSDAKLLTQAFDIMGQGLLLTQFKNDIEHERKVIVKEFNLHYPHKHKIPLLFDFYKRKMLYEGHWFERFVRPLGTPKSINKITKLDLQTYYDVHYTPANMSIVCVGGMALSQIVEILSKSIFAIEKDGKRTPYPTPVIDSNSPKKVKCQSEVLMSLVGVFRKDAYYLSQAKDPSSISVSSLNVVRIMLNKVLHEEVREKRAWTYSISASFYNLRCFYEFSIHCNALKRVSVKDINDVIEGCIAGLSSREDLLDEAKRRVTISNTMVDLSGKVVCDSALSNLATYYRIRTLTEINNEINSVTMEDVREVLKWLTPECRWTFTI